MLNSAKFQEVAKGAFATVILSNTAMTSFALIDYPKYDRARTEQDVLDGKVLFIGITSIVDGVPRSALNADIGTDVIEALSQAYIRHIASLIGADPGAVANA